MKNTLPYNFQKLKTDFKAGLQKISAGIKGAGLLNNRPLLLIILMAAVMRFGFFLETHTNPIHTFIPEMKAFDQNHFYTLACDLIGNNFVGSYSVKYSPGYAYIIAALFSIFSLNVKVVYVFQILLGILATFIAYRTADLVFSNKKIGLIAAFLFAVYPPMIFNECTLLRDCMIAYVNLFFFYFLLLALKKEKAGYFLLSGILAGISMALRSNALVVFILLYLVLHFRASIKNAMPYIFLFILGVSVPVLPLSARNSMLGGTAALSTYGTEVFWVGNSYDSMGIEFNPTAHQDKLANEAAGDPLRALKILSREIRQHPKEYKDLYARKIKMFLNNYEIASNLSYNLFKERSLVLKIGVLNFGLLSCFGLLSMLLLVTNRSANIRLLYIFLLVLSLSVILFHIQSRYRIPAVPFFILFSAFAIHWISQLAVQKKFLKLAAAATIILALGLYVKNDRAIIDRYFGAHVRCNDYWNMSLAYKDLLIKRRGAAIAPKNRRRQLREYLYYQIKTAACSNNLSAFRDLAQIYRELGDAHSAAGIENYIRNEFSSKN